MNVNMMAGYAAGIATATTAHQLARHGLWKTGSALIIGMAALIVFLSACANPTAPTDPCAKPDSPRGCTPPSCPRPVCY